MNEAHRVTPRSARSGGPGRLLGIVLGAVVVLLLATCDVVEPPPSPSPTPIGSGLRGSVVIIVDCADPGAEPPCEEPYQARLVILDADSEKVAEVSSDESGGFSVALAPGGYTVAPVPGGEPYPTAPLLSVSVVEGQYTQVVIRYDSGTR